MGKSTSTGVLVAVSGGAPATYDQAGYEAKAWTNAGELINLGEFGFQADEVTSQPLATGITEYFQGFANYGQMPVGFDRDSLDAGQIIINAHAGGANKGEILSVRVTLQDGYVFYLDTRVFSYTTNVGAANQMIGATVNMRVNRQPVEVAA